MKKLPIFALLIPLLFVLTACPYSQSVPLDKPTQKINKKMLGKWVEEQPPQRVIPPNYFVISQFDEKTYQIQYNLYEKRDYLRSNHTAYVTEIGKTIFLNARNEKPESPFYFYKIEIAADGDSFTLSEVVPHVKEKFNNSQDLKAFFQKQKDISFFYGDYAKRYLRVKE
jgi:hypothetical protein